MSCDPTEGVRAYASVPRGQRVAVKLAGSWVVFELVRDLREESITVHLPGGSRLVRQQVVVSTVAVGAYSPVASLLRAGTRRPCVSSARYIPAACNLATDDVHERIALERQRTVAVFDGRRSSNKSCHVAESCHSCDGGCTPSAWYTALFALIQSRRSATEGPSRRRGPGDVEPQPDLRQAVFRAMKPPSLVRAAVMLFAALSSRGDRQHDKSQKMSFGSVPDMSAADSVALQRGTASRYILLSSDADAADSQTPLGTPPSE